MNQPLNPNPNVDINVPTDATAREHLEAHIEALEDTMHEAQQFRTLEEQVADMKRRGINPRENFDKWDKEDGVDEDWGSNDVGEVKPIQMDDGKEPKPPLIV